MTKPALGRCFGKTERLPKYELIGENDDRIRLVHK